MAQQTVIFLGPQGSGKGTQVQLFKDFLNREDPGHGVVHFEAGAALRSFGAEGGYTQQLVHESLLRGELQPMFILGFVIARFFIDALKKGDEHVIIDGFPRTAEQLEIFDSMMRFYRRNQIAAVWIDISDEEAVSRLLKRGRSDDTEEGIRNRLAWGGAQVRPTFESFKHDQRYQVFEIDGARDVNEVHKDILQKLGLQ